MNRISRIIPAHAGNTAISEVSQVLGKDHPRSCGEYHPAGYSAGLYTGSSPLMRGILVCCDQNGDLMRIIPAHAGNTASTAGSATGRKDHPRSCGEYEYFETADLNKLGSSPLMRGIPLHIEAISDDARIIPAHAGNTRLTLMAWLLLKDHPRSCGEYKNGESDKAGKSGSSPLMRGIPALVRDSPS